MNDRAFIGSGTDGATMDMDGILNPDTGLLAAGEYLKPSPRETALEDVRED
jgi:hypothetical protein